MNYCNSGTLSNLCLQLDKNNLKSLEYKINKSNEAKIIGKKQYIKWGNTKIDSIYPHQHIIKALISLKSLILLGISPPTQDWSIRS